jgi:DNA-directed RNA polymerase specialized sigma24 family protein
MIESTDPGVFFRLNRAILMNQLRSMVCENDREDVLEDFLLQILRRGTLGKWSPWKGSFSAYIKKQLMWTVTDYYRRQKRIHKKEMHLSELMEDWGQEE